MKRTVILSVLVVAFALVIGIAVASILFAIGVITYDDETAWLAFLENVGYSVFAGIIVVLIIELYKYIEKIKGDTE